MNADEQMLAEHQRMWHDFCQLIKWGIVGAIIVFAIVMYLLI